MAAEVSTICLPMPFRLGSVNCYLFQAGAGFLLLDTGAPANRSALEAELDRLGCRPGDLRLIVLTHGDFDHTGSAAYLRQKYGAKIAMHPDDAGMAEHADMFWNRGRGNFLLKRAIPLLFGFRSRSRFRPDLAVQDGLDLQEYGLAGCLVSLPGHSKGSIGLLTAAGDLFCGDLLMNDTGKPALGFGDPAGFAASIARVKHMQPRAIYPGHGKPFRFEDMSHL